MTDLAGANLTGRDEDMMPEAERANAKAFPAKRNPARDTAISLTLAALIIGAWATAHIVGIFFWDLTTQPVWASVALAVFIAWLYVGLFIVAHDTMHYSLVPRVKWANRLVGQLCLGLYAGFSFDNLILKHRDHHVYAGTDRDPDFHDARTLSFLPWYFKFFSEYFGWQQGVIIAAWVAAYVALLGVDLANIWAFWAGPALISSLQLFTFGTYLPHKEEADAPFDDHHNARTNNMPWLVSLLTCFHFGYHHEHHLHPSVPWWRLPAAHAQYLRARG